MEEVIQNLQYCRQKHINMKIIMLHLDNFTFYIIIICISVRLKMDSVLSRLNVMT